MANCLTSDGRAGSPQRKTDFDFGTRGLNSPDLLVFFLRFRPECWKSFSGQTQDPNQRRRDKTARLAGKVRARTQTHQSGPRTTRGELTPEGRWSDYRVEFCACGLTEWLQVPASSGRKRAKGPAGGLLTAGKGLLCLLRRGSYGALADLPKLLGSEGRRPRSIPSSPVQSSFLFWNWSGKQDATRHLRYEQPEAQETRTREAMAIMGGGRR